MPLPRRRVIAPPLAAINLTPMLDVMCNLLIVFMIVAPTLKSGLRIDLPVVENAPLLTERKSYTIQIQKPDTPDAAPRMYLEDRRVDLEDLKTQLADYKRLYAPELDILIEADRLVPCEALLKVLAVTREVGLDSVGVITMPLETEKK